MWAQIDDQTRKLKEERKSNRWLKKEIKVMKRKVDECRNDDISRERKEGFPGKKRSRNRTKKSHAGVGWKILKWKERKYMMEMRNCSKLTSIRFDKIEQNTEYALFLC